MDKVIDIYTKLIIAIISFIAPLIIHLLSMFSDGLAHIKNRSDNELSQINELVKKQVQEQEGEMQELMKESNRLYEERKKKLQRQQNTLDPKRQIKRIFPTLFLSLVFFAFYMLAEDQKWGGEQNVLLLYVLFGLSFACATLGVIFLKNVAWTVIEIKDQLARDKDKSEERVEKAPTN